MHNPRPDDTCRKKQLSIFEMYLPQRMRTASDMGEVRGG
jgi:hypothetical protein